MTRFAILAMIKPQAAELRLFVEHHLACGAAQILLFHDGPIDTLVADGINPDALAERGVDLVALDDAFWAARAIDRPGDFITRRTLVHRLGIARCRTEWVFICDEDEFLHAPGPIDTALAAVPDDVDSIVLPLGEAAWGPGDPFPQPFASTWFRMPYPPSAMDQWGRDRFLLYGPWALLISKGVVSHALSKQFLRVNAKFDLVDTHRSFRDGREVSVRAADLGGPIAEVKMLHFDAIGYRRWLRKWQGRRLDPTMNSRAQRVRRRQEKLIFRAVRSGDWAARRVFRLLYGLNRRQARLLERRGQIFRAEPFADRLPLPNGDAE